jgi:hypothetical protein
MAAPTGTIGPAVQTTNRRGWTRSDKPTADTTERQNDEGDRRVPAGAEDAVASGAWAPMEVMAAVACDFTTDRAEILATLWDLRDDGLLCYDASGNFPGFRPAVWGLRKEEVHALIG